MAASSATPSRKLRILLMPFFATSHIAPYTDLAFHLATARPDLIEATVAVTPANVPIVRSAVARREATASIKVATYAFPAVDGLPPGVENLSKAKAADSWRIVAAAVDEGLMRPGQESLIRESSPDAIISDVPFFWNEDIAGELGVPCIIFCVTGSFSYLAMRRIGLAEATDDDGFVRVPRFPGPEIRVPVTELPEFLRLRIQQVSDRSIKLIRDNNRCFGFATNTFFDLEHEYCELLTANGYVKRAYFVGPLSLVLPPPAPPTQQISSSPPCIDWLDTKPDRSVVYVCFGSFAHITDAQLAELALGLEASGTPFLWVVRSDSDSWAPPDGWSERVGDRGMVVTDWAPQDAILAHRAVGAFVTHCGWSSLLETVVAGVPVLTWPLVFDHFIIERLVTQVLAIGERLWPEGAGVRSTRYQEHELIPSQAVARAVATFMEPGGAGDAARIRVKKLSVKAHAAMAEGGSSHRDLRRLIDDLLEARYDGAPGTLP